MFNSKLKKEIRSLRDLVERSRNVAEAYRRETLDAYRKLQSLQDALMPVSVFYTLTDSDFVNYKQETARAKVARQRMAMALGNKIAKVIEPEEVIEDGVLIGYKYSLQVRRAPVYEENPKLEPVWPDVRPMIDKYEAIWKEGQK